MDTLKCIGSFVMLLFVLGLAGCKTTPSSVVLARDGKAQIKIVRAENVIPSENRAITELTNYLFKVTGAGFEVINEKDVTDGLSAIYVGPTAFAKKQGIEIEKLGKEESIIRTVGNNLIIAGGRPRGTLYGVYIFLEEAMGVRWYTPWFQKVPVRPTCSVGILNFQRKPYFNMRDHYGVPWAPWQMKDFSKPCGGEDWSWWIQRNRLNGHSMGRGIWYQTPYEESPIGEETGGGWIPGGFSSHTFWYYFPPDEYFDKHPEFFSMRGGKRVRNTNKDISCSGNHLCLTNKEMRKQITEKVLDKFRKIPSAEFVSVSQNDGGCHTFCDCPECRAFVAKNGNEADLYMDFVNEIADAAKKEFPGKYILAMGGYQPVVDPPLKFKPHDNVIVLCCTTPSASFVYFPNLEQTYRYRYFEKWAAVSKNLWVWEYYNNIFISFGYLRPEWWQIEENIRRMKRFGVTGVGPEDEFKSMGSVLAEFYEMRLWIYAKMIDNPDLNVEELMKDFLNGSYDKAGPYLFEYIMTQKERRPLWPYQFVDYEYIHKSQTLFDQAEAAVADQPDLLNRVKTARIQLDVTTLVWRNQAIRDYLEQGGKIESYPYKKEVIKDRLLKALESTTHPLWHHLGGHVWDYKYPKKTMREVAMMYVEMISGGDEYRPLPEEVRKYPVKSVIEIPLGMLDGEERSLVKDSEALLGIAYKCPKKGLPVSTCMGEGLLAPARVTLDRNSIKGAGFHIYKASRQFKMCDTSSIQKRSILYTEGVGYPGVHLYNLYDPSNTNQLWEFYVSAKVSGLDKGDQEAEVYYDCYYLVKVTEEAQNKKTETGGKP